MLRTIIISSKVRISGDTSEYTVRLGESFATDDCDYYEMEMKRWIPDSGYNGTISADNETIAVRMNFSMPFSYSVARKGPIDTIGFVSLKGTTEALSLAAGYPVIIKKPNFSILKVEHVSQATLIPYVADEHLIVLTLKPIKKL